MMMTDRQIVAVYFPELLPKKVQGKQTISYREAFWKICEGQGLTEAATQAAWKQHGDGT